MIEDEKDNNTDNKEEENNDDFLEIDNLNINQEVDIKENPKKHIVNSKKQTMKNIQDENCINCPDEIDSIKKIKTFKKTRKITYDDIYLGNEMFVTRSKSFSKDLERNNKYIKQFSKMYNKSSNFNNISIENTSNNSNSNNNSGSTNNISNISLNEEEEYEDDDIGLLRNNSYDYFGKKEESTQLKVFLASINNHRKNNYENILLEGDNIFIDEDEKKNENIFFIENETELKSLSYYNKKNRCNLSYISLNLFIKKICIENLKNNFPILYKSFIYQYQEFLSISSLIEKLIEAFYFYSKKMNIEIPDLISLINQILSNQYKEIQNDEKLLEKLRQLYNDIKGLSWIDESLQKEIDNINFILSSDTSDDFDLNYTKYLIHDRKKTKAISIRTRTKAKVLNNKTMYKYPYFYIFDFSDEEIARNLTLISYKMLSSININELLNNSFIKEDKYQKAPNVMKLIDRFEKLMLFIIEDICSYETNKSRAKLITRWANIAQRCKDLHNYNDLLIINQCFNNTLLKKMISAWKKLPKSTLTLIAELNKFCTNQQCYINIRREIVGCKHIAYIPYLGILLKEIVDIENKYKYMERIEENNCINCIKLQKLYWVINKFFEFKNYTFTFTQINDLNILNKLNPRTNEEIETLINTNEKNISTFKELIQTGNKKKPTKSDESFYC